MRKAMAVLFIAALLAVVGSPVALADVVIGTRSASAFTSNDSLHWGLLGPNNFFVVQGSTLSTTNGIVTTVNFGPPPTFNGGTGATFVQCPAGGCSWSGNFAPGDILLSDLNFLAGGPDSGRINLSFATPIQAIGFQLEPNAAPAAGSVLNFNVEIAVYDGSTFLGAYYPAWFEESHFENNSAGFYGVIDSTGANITSLQVLAYDCGGVGPDLCQGFSINHARVEDAGVGTAAAATPEPASFALLGSGLGMLCFLRRKLTTRN
jgi:PEP-CTERM motif